MKIVIDLYFIHFPSIIKIIYLRFYKLFITVTFINFFKYFCKQKIHKLQYLKNVSIILQNKEFLFYTHTHTNIRIKKILNDECIIISENISQYSR